MVNSSHMFGALMSLGMRADLAGFTAGAVTFLKNDIHQVYRQPFDPNKVFYLNIYTMNPEDSCEKNKGKILPNGLPCNANPAFQQHGFSTTVRQRGAGGSFEERFKSWFSKALTKPSWASERILTQAGMASVLEKARGPAGDKSGETSLNSDNSKAGSNLEFYHPSIKNRTAVAISNQFLAITGWTMLLRAFGKRKLP